MATEMDRLFERADCVKWSVAYALDVTAARPPIPAGVTIRRVSDALGVADQFAVMSEAFGRTIAVPTGSELETLLEQSALDLCGEGARSKTPGVGGFTAR